MEIPDNYSGFAKCPYCKNENAIGDHIQIKCPYCFHKITVQNIIGTLSYCPICEKEIWVTGDRNFEKKPSAIKYFYVNLFTFILFIMTLIFFYICFKNFFASYCLSIVIIIILVPIFNIAAYFIDTRSPGSPRTIDAFEKPYRTNQVVATPTIQERKPMKEIIQKTNPSVFISLGREKEKKGNYLEAIKDYTEAISIDPNSAVAYYERGSLFLDMGKYDEALNDLNKAISLKSNYSEAYYDRAVAKKNLGYSLDEIISDFNLAIKNNPNDADAYYCRAVFGSFINPLQAIQDFTKALTIRPNFAKAYLGRGLLRENNNKTEGEEDILMAIKIDPELVSELSVFEQELIRIILLKHTYGK